MSVLEIVKKYLEAEGFDGLYHQFGCACEKNDLAPCGNFGPDCEPGYKTACRCGEGCDFDIRAEKEPTP